jgi:hypothetical protein
LNYRYKGLSKLLRKDIEHYKLFYRRFVHLSPKKIRILYKVTILAKSVKVPTDTETCEVYVLIRIRNKISRKLSL